ncbi:hypothetical protein GCM10027403_21140 [Arthrobacter tecti]
MSGICATNWGLSVSPRYVAWVTGWCQKIPEALRLIVPDSVFTWTDPGAVGGTHPGPSEVAAGLSCPRLATGLYATIAADERRRRAPYGWSGELAVVFPSMAAQRERRRSRA